MATEEKRLYGELKFLEEKIAVFNEQLSSAENSRTVVLSQIFHLQKDGFKVGDTIVNKKGKKGLAIELCLNRSHIHDGIEMSWGWYKPVLKNGSFGVPLKMYRFHEWRRA